MEMVSSTISDLRPFVWRQDLLLGVNSSVVRLQFYRYNLSYLTSPSRSWSFSHGCPKEDYPRNIYSGRYVLDNGDSYTRFSSDVDQAVRSLFSRILVLVLSPMLVDYFNGCVRTRSLSIAAQIKNIETPLLIFACIWYDIYVIILLYHGRKRVWRPRRLARFF
jgi:hypothetical protein